MALIRKTYVSSFVLCMYVTYSVINKGSYLKAKVAYNNMHKRILGYSRRDSASGMFASNVIDTFDALLRKNIKDAFLT